MDAPLVQAPPPLRVSPELPLEIVEDIFLRVPPEDCALLLRAALACKTWARLFAGRVFRRRYRERHGGGASPMLGFLANLADTGGVARFIPATTTSGGGFRPFPGEIPGYRAHDAHHGRVLLSKVTSAAHDGHSIFLTVWFPITGEGCHLPPLLRHQPVRSWNAAVLCGGYRRGGDSVACDHLDCNSFNVVVVGTDTRELFVYVYSPEFGAWTILSTARLVGDHLDGDMPGVLASEALHFVLLKGTRILKYDLFTRQVSTIRLPNQRRSYGPRIRLMAMEDGRLGFAEVCTVTNMLRLSSMNIDPRNGGISWELTRFIDLNTVLPAEALMPMKFLPRVVAIAEGVDVVFLKTVDGLYTLGLKSGKVTKIPMASGFYDIVPYVSFYAPVLRAALVPSGVGTIAGASTSANNIQHVDPLALSLSLPGVGASTSGA